MELRPLSSIKTLKYIFDEFFLPDVKRIVFLKTAVTSAITQFGPSNDIKQNKKKQRTRKWQVKSFGNDVPQMVIYRTRQQIREIL